MNTQQKDKKQPEDEDELYSDDGEPNHHSNFDQIRGYEPTRDELLMMRAKRPTYHDHQRQCVLNFSGRVDKSSKKNIQIEYKSRIDDKVRIVL